jgi:hypothetical protein
MIVDVPPTRAPAVSPSLILPFSASTGALSCWHLCSGFQPFDLDQSYDSVAMLISMHA